MRIVIAGNYGAGNIGDEMILEGLIKLLRKNLENCELSVISGNPELTEEKHQVKSANLFPSGIRSILESIFKSKNHNKELVKSADAFILGGGGLFASLSFRANIIWAIQARAALKFGKPLIICGQSIGKTKNPISKMIIRYIFNKASFISLRDSESIRNLEEIGVKKEVFFIPDFAFNLKNAYKITAREKKIAVCLRQMEGLPKNFHKEVADFLNELAEKHNYKIEFIDFQKGEDDDLIIHNKVIDRLCNKCHFKHFNHIREPELMLEHMSKASFVLAMRFHSVISALMTSTPFLAIEYADKVRDFLISVKMPKHGLALEQTTCQKLIENWEKLKNDGKRMPNLSDEQSKPLIEFLKSI